MKQKPLDGTSLVYTFDNAAAPIRHTTRYFEITNNRSIYKDGWIAGTGLSSFSIPSNLARTSSAAFTTNWHCGAGE